MAVYLFNSPVLTDYGEYRFSGPLSAGEAGALLADGFVSAVGHAGTAAMLGEILGIEIPLARISARMRPGDRAVVLRRKARPPEGVFLTAAELRDWPHELGLLERKLNAPAYSPGRV